MGIEGRGLEHLGEGKLHRIGEGREVGCGNLAIFVLNQMQILDQEIAAARPVAEQKLNFVRRRRIDLAALGGRFGPLSSLAGVLEGADRLGFMTYRTSIPSDLDRL